MAQESYVVEGERAEILIRFDEEQKAFAKEIEECLYQLNHLKMKASTRGNLVRESLVEWNPDLKGKCWDFKVDEDDQSVIIDIHDHSNDPPDHPFGDLFRRRR